MLYTDRYFVGAVMDYCLWMHNKPERNTVMRALWNKLHIQQEVWSVVCCLKTPCFS